MNSMQIADNTKDFFAIRALAAAKAYRGIIKLLMKYSFIYELVNLSHYLIITYHQETYTYIFELGT